MTALKAKDWDAKKSKLLLKSVQDPKLTINTRLVLDLFIATMEINEVRGWDYSKIVEITGITDTTTVSKMIKVLEDRGYVEKTISKTNGRRRDIKLLGP
jgi:DNA-binding MarR family transcriptional regulator